MKAWSFCDAATGVFSGRTFSGSERALARNTPPGTIAVEGKYDRRLQRVDVAAMEAARGDHSPPGDFVIAREPELSVVRDQQRLAALQQIAAIESGVSQRLFREALLQVLPDGPIRQRVQAIEDAIAKHRQDAAG